MEAVAKQLNSLHTSSKQFLPLRDLKVNKRFLVKHVDLQDTRIGRKIVLHVSEYLVSLPDRYLTLFDPKLVDKINNSKEHLYITYEGKQPLSANKHFHKITFTTGQDYEPDASVVSCSTADGDSITCDEELEESPVKTPRRKKQLSN